MLDVNYTWMKNKILKIINDDKAPPSDLLVTILLGKEQKKLLYPILPSVPRDTSLGISHTLQIWGPQVSS